MIVGKLFSVATHIVAILPVMELIMRLPCTVFPLNTNLMSVVTSMNYHFCTLLSGAVCLFSLFTHQMLDHGFVEAALHTVLLRGVPFPQEYQRTAVSLVVIFIGIYVKLATDTMYYSGVLCAIWITLAAKRVWTSIYFYAALVSGGLAFLFYFMEGAEGNDLFHNCWHMFGELGLYFYLKALRPLKCSLTCECKIHPPVYIIDPDNGYKIQVFDLFVGSMSYLRSLPHF